MYKKAGSSTPIDSLPDLDDLENGMKTQVANPPYPGAAHIPPGEVDRLNKFIRQPHQTPDMAGMGTGTTPIDFNTPSNSYSNNPGTTPILQESFDGCAASNSRSSLGDEIEGYHSGHSSPYGHPHHMGTNSATLPSDSHNKYRSGLYSSDPLTSISCLEIANHIATCPICSQVYRNDRTVYLVVIVILVIICLYLAKTLLKI